MCIWVGVGDRKKRGGVGNLKVVCRTEARTNKSRREVNIARVSLNKPETTVLNRRLGWEIWTGGVRVAFSKISP